MIRLWLIYFGFFVLFYVGIPSFLALTGRQKWAVTKLSIYSLLCSMLALGAMTLIVILF
jgi:hypothetical protein